MCRAACKHPPPHPSNAQTQRGSSACCKLGTGRNECFARYHPLSKATGSPSPAPPPVVRDQRKFFAVNQRQPKCPRNTDTHANSLSRSPLPAYLYDSVGKVPASPDPLPCARWPRHSGNRISRRQTPFQNTTDTPPPPTASRNVHTASRPKKPARHTKGNSSFRECSPYLANLIRGKSRVANGQPITISVPNCTSQNPPLSR